MPARRPRIVSPVRVGNRARIAGRVPPRSAAQQALPADPPLRVGRQKHKTFSGCGEWSAASAGVGSEGWRARVSSFFWGHRSRWRSGRSSGQASSAGSWGSSAGSCSRSAGGGRGWWRASAPDWWPVVLATCASHSEPSRLDAPLELRAQVRSQVGCASLEPNLEVGGGLVVAGRWGASQASRAGRAALFRVGVLLRGVAWWMLRLCTAEPAVRDRRSAG
jgi:hypothetical protein